jgi:acyl transferase domain-containing protein/NAD(P)-dependent dehydrogenase (short-subunit alcohol dehydrogenase family)/acyl-CoA thioesterase FadM
MPFWATPYRVLFHDTMAYGSHHFLANFKFQCIAREHLFFEEIVDFSPAGRADHESIVFLTRDAYSRNLAPVRVGEKVAILVSAEEPTRSSVRFCFRVIRQDGVPVSCGFQTMVCISKETGVLVPAPPSVLRGSGMMTEEMRSPPFAERVIAGKTERLFPERIVALGKDVANSPVERFYPRFVKEDGPVEHALRTSAPRPFKKGLAFVLPGQGSYCRWLLRDLREADAKNAAILGAADEITRELLGTPLLPLILADSNEEHDEIIRCAPGLAQVGIYLCATLSARLLLRAGVQPDVLLGHSAGELAALAIGGVYDIETGTEIICHRVRALEGLEAARAGGMVAVPCGADRAARLLASLAPSSLEIAVVNHDEQTIVSGSEPDLVRLGELTTPLGLARRIQSPFPFHCRLLEPAVKPFADALLRFRFGAPRIPVYSAIEGGFYSADGDWPQRLASHFVRPFSFPHAVEALDRHGARVFVECSGRRVLTAVLARLFAGRDGVEFRTPFAARRTLRAEVAALSESFAERPLSPEPRPEAVAAPQLTHAQSSAGDPLPIAIVSLGCVLPGAANADGFWRNVLEKRNAISDAGVIAAELATAFLAVSAESRSGIVPDKTYTLLGGFIDDLALDPARTGFSPEQLEALVSSQRFAAGAMAECLSGLRSLRPDPLRTKVFVGATADGIREYDEALVVAGLQAKMPSFTADRNEQEQLRSVLASTISRPHLVKTTTYETHVAVAVRLVGPGVGVLAVDAACASSLYAIDLAAKALQDHECDLALAGGVFAPGPANSCLFSQFGGLSATGSRPFDAAGDGVVFGEGSAFVALKRLPDALAQGDTIRAIIRGTGLSSDGKSPSVAVPQKDGQVLAIRRAYQRTGIPPSSVQYVEAHATATPVGDAVEFGALQEVFGPSCGATKRVELGSVKALVGHTGWTAGAASLIKMTRALEERTVPPQGGFERASDKIDLSRSPFVISTEPRSWPHPGTNEPIRAGVNSFGFGGSNAHLILERFEPEYHARWRRAGAAPRRGRLAVVGVGAAFPERDEHAESGPGRDSNPARFDASIRRLPKGARILPDVADHMDTSQFVATLASVDALAGLLNGTGDDPRRSSQTKLASVRADVAVVLGLQGKTERGIAANQRIYLDYIDGRLAPSADRVGLPPPVLRRLRDGLFAAVRNEVPVSNPYTLPGLMPNVAAGRVANVLDLHGPNMIVDAGGPSLLEALRIAEAILRRGESKLALAGGVNAYAGIEPQLSAVGGRKVGEGAVVLLLALPETAAVLGLPVRAQLSFAPGGAASSETALEVGRDLRAPDLRGADGAFEILAALDTVARRREPAVVRWQGRGEGEALSLRIEPPPEVASRAGMLGPETPVFYCAPRLVAKRAPQAERSFALDSARLLVLTDDPAAPGELRSKPPGLELVWLCPASSPVPGAIAIDLSTDASIERDWSQIDAERFDAVVAWKDLSRAAEWNTEQGAAEEELLYLLFSAARRFYQPLKTGRSALGSLCIGGPGTGSLPPFTGLLSGFLKSVAREIAGASCKAVITDASDPVIALRSLAFEWGQGPLPAATEVVYRGGVRHESELHVLREPSTAAAKRLGPESVVLATGGARGVTAVLAEEFVQNFGSALVLVGRTNPRQASADVLAMTDEEFEAHESDFYRDQGRMKPTIRLPELKRQFNALRAAREVEKNLARLRALGGRVEYRCADVTNRSEIGAVVNHIAEKFGRLDLVVHGAGVQSSKALPKKTIDEFRSIVSTKMLGLRWLQRACRERLPSSKVEFHVLSSSFSYFGNDGQPDYGAANEAMNRVAEWMSARGEDGGWTSLAWLGWAGIGMTRGSEYAALARARGLRAISAAEGRALFGRLLQGEPAAPVNILMSAGESAFYGIPIVPEAPADATPGSGAPQARWAGNGRPVRSAKASWPLSVGTAPYLSDHLVGGRPTVPATFEAELAARTARALWPESHVVGMEETRLTRFAKLPGASDLVLRGQADLIEERNGEAVAHVRLLSDFVHRSGRILQKDVQHFESRVRLARHPDELQGRRIDDSDWRGFVFQDPYLAEGAAVQLDGFFRCLSNIEIGARARRARFHIRAAEKLYLIRDFLTPAVLLDALFRFSMIHDEPGGGLPLYVPLRCQRTLLAPNVNDVSLHEHGTDLLLEATNPRKDGETMFNEHAQVRDQRGRILLIVEDLEARRFGAVSDAR